MVSSVVYVTYKLTSLRKARLKCMRFEKRLGFRPRPFFDGKHFVIMIDKSLLNKCG